MRRQTIRAARVGILGVATVTPAYQSLEALWQACLRPSAHPPAGARLPWEELTSRAVRATLAASGLPTSDSALVLGTTKGDIDPQIAWMRAADARGDAQAGTAQAQACLSPPPVLGAGFTGLVARLGFGRPGHAVSTACSSGLVALIEAALLVTEDQTSFAVALGADLASDFVRDGFAALKALSPTRCRPFDARRDGLALGSAAAAMAIGPPGNAGLAVSGYGMANDATHMTAPDRQAGGLMRAIQMALDSGGLEPHDIDAIVAHGTGTRYNDAMEATAFRTLFAHRPAITAIKGLIGHTLGAAGLIEAAVACRMLQEQVVPPICGLETPEYPELDLVTGAPRPMKLRRVLKVASGFGGMNAAVILERGDAPSGGTR